jgi:hypothetical protein
MTPEGFGEMAVTREAEIERESAELRLVGKPGERLLHPDAQQILVNRFASLGPEYPREMVG